MEKMKAPLSLAVIKNELDIGKKAVCKLLDGTHVTGDVITLKLPACLKSSLLGLVGP